MRFRLEKKHEGEHIHAYSAGGFWDSFKRTLSPGKDTEHTVDSSPKSFNSLKEEESFQIQAELYRNNALLCEIMLPPR